MDRRAAIGVVGVVVVVSAGLMGYQTVGMDAREPTYTPETLASYERTSNITGPQAKALISELHRQPSAVAGFERAIVAAYGEGDRENAPITIYASVHGSDGEAENNITRMVAAMDSSPALHVENVSVEGETVYMVESENVVFAFFSYRETAYWVTHSRSVESETSAIVAEIIETNQDSRRLLPFP